jgi:hypothetical protein
VPGSIAWREALLALRFYRDWAVAAPHEVSSYANLWHAPGLEEIRAEHHHTPIVMYRPCTAGRRRMANMARPIAGGSGARTTLVWTRRYAVPPRG